MSEFKNKSITTKGMELLSKALSGEPIEFTRIELGDGQYDGDLGFAERLVNVKQDLPINNLDRNGSQVTLSAILRVEDITSSFNWSEIGIYAKGADGSEHLYMYGYTENTSYISKDSLNEKLIHVTVMVSNVAEVTANIDDSLVYLTAEALKEHDMNQEAHKDIRKSISLIKEDLGNIDISWDGIKDKPNSFPPSNHSHNNLDMIGENASIRIGNYYANDTGIFGGKKDGGDLQGCNLDIKSWYGVGFVNSCSSTDTYKQTTVAIDVRNGKIISKGDIYSNGINLSTSLAYKGLFNSNIDDLVCCGSYRLGEGWSGTVPKGQSIDTCRWGVLLTTGDGMGDTCVQELITTNHSAYPQYANRKYRRIRFSAKWSEWEEIGGSMIKSIQRGYMSIPKTTGSNDINISISAIDPTKSTVILNGSGSFESTYYIAGLCATVKNLTATNLAVQVYSSSTACAPAISWQVVEYK